MKKIPVEIHSDCSGAHTYFERGVYVSQPTAFKLGFVVYDSENNVNLLEGCYKLSAKKFFNHNTSYAEAFACLLALYHFDALFDPSKYTITVHLDNLFVISILNGQESRYIRNLTLAPELRNYFTKLNSPKIVEAHGNKNRAHKIARKFPEHAASFLRSGDI